MSDVRARQAEPPLAPRLALLTGEGFLIGLALALLSVAANTLFLVQWGAAWLPWIYIGNALLVSSCSFGVLHWQRHWATGRIALTVVMIFTAFTLLARLGLATPWTTWGPPVLMVNSALGGLLVTVVIGGMTGWLLDLRQVKRYFPMIRAGVNGGLFVGSISAPALVILLAGVENLLLVTLISLVFALVILVILTMRFRGFLATAVVKSKTPPRSFAALLRQRYTVYLFIYRMLNVSGPLIVVFVIMSAAKTRFPTAAALAGFLGGYDAAVCIASVLLAVTIAGWLLTRFGLSLGLVVGAFSLSGGLMVALSAGLIWGVDSALCFWLMVVGVALQAVLSEAITFPSLKTVYQALPAQEKQQVETTADGIFMPLAVGLTGILLLGLNLIPGLQTVHVLVIALLLTAPQTLVGRRVYGGYRTMLLRTLSHRALGDAELTLADSSSLAVVEKLLQSSQLSEVRLALDLLERAEHRSLPAHLAALTRHSAELIQVEALRRIARLRSTVALPEVVAALHSAGPPARTGAALRAICALQGAAALTEVAPFLNYADPAVRTGAVVGLLQHGGEEGVARAGTHLLTGVRSPKPSERIFVAHVIGELDGGAFAQPLATLLLDNNLTVRQAALLAAQHAPHGDLIPLLLANLASSTTRSAAMAALVACGELLLPVVETALATATPERVEEVRRLVRVCGQIKGEGMIALLKRHLDHPAPEIQQVVLLALHRCGYRVGEDEVALVDRALLRCAGQGLRLLLARQEMGDEITLVALRQALAEEFAALYGRVFLLLALGYHPRALMRAGERLRHGGSNDQAVALETLDVTLTARQKRLVLPLVDESRPLYGRIEQLKQHIPLTSQSRNERLREIITQQATWRQAWTRACAIYGVGKLGLVELTDVVKLAQTDSESVTSETATWALELHTGTQKRQRQPLEIGASPYGYAADRV